MSSLQKFHRRTNGGATPFAFTSLGSGDETHGFWVGWTSTGIKLIAAPKSTEATLSWGSYGTQRNTISTTNGLANTNTLVSFGTSSHPAAGQAKYLTTGGYNTWYLPSKAELVSAWGARNSPPFNTADSFVGSYYWSSTEDGFYSAWYVNMGSSFAFQSGFNKNRNYYVRAVRQSAV